MQRWSRWLAPCGVYGALFRTVPNALAQRLHVADVTGLTAREKKARRYSVDVAEHVDFGQAPAAAA